MRGTYVKGLLCRCGFVVLCVLPLYGMPRLSCIVLYQRRDLPLVTCTGAKEPVAAGLHMLTCQVVLAANRRARCTARC